MDEREGMSSFYLNRGISGSVPPSGFSSHGDSNISLPSSLGSSFQLEHNSSPIFPHGGGDGGDGGGGVVSMKKKRGRPRKYAPDESHMELGLTPAPLSASPGSITPIPRKNRGRPPGSGWKQRLANVGEWMSNSAGLAFTPFIIHVPEGEDVAEKILSFAQRKPRAVCILSGSGTVSTITLSQSVTYEGLFEILCLSGSYLLAEDGGSQNRTGGLSISACSGDGNVIGGAIGGKLIASTLVQVVVCSFVYGGGNNVKVKTKTEESTLTDDKSCGIQLNETTSQPVEKPVVVSWQPDSKNMCSEIDLTCG